MKKTKRLLSLVICLAIIFVFAGCGNGQTASQPDISGEEWETTVIEGDATVTGGNDKVVSGSGAVQGDSDVTAALAKNKDFLNSLKGLEINIYTQQQEKPTRGTTTGDRYFAILSKVAKQYDVTINYLEKSPGDLQQSILAGKPAANVIGVQDYNFISWLNAGVAADLTGAMKKTGISFKESWYNPDATKIGNLNNKQYAFNADTYEPYMLMYNKRLLQENGLSDPIGLYNSDEWSFDRLDEYLSKLTKKSSDGNVLIYGMSCTGTPMLGSMLIGMNGTDIITSKDGKLESNINDSKVKRALSYLQEWYYTDRRVTSTVNWQDAFNYFSSGKSAMVLGSKYVFDNMNENNMTDAVGVVPFPYGPDASASTPYSYVQVFMNIIPKSEEKNADKILFIMNEVYKQQYAVRNDDFADSYRTLIRDNDSYNIFKDYSLGTKQMKLSNFNISGLVYEEKDILMNLCLKISTGTAVETTVQTYSSSLETNLDEVWGKWTITG